MTTLGILESLLATALWAALVYVYRKTKKRYKKAEKESKIPWRNLLNFIRWTLEGKPSISRRQDLYLVLTLTSGRLKNYLNQFYHQRILSFLGLIYLFFTLSGKESLYNLLLHFIGIALFIVLIVLQSRDIRDIIIQNEEFDLNIVQAFLYKNRPSKNRKKRVTDKTKT
jgi:hypothetical protein